MKFKFMKLLFVFALFSSSLLLADNHEHAEKMACPCPMMKKIKQMAEKDMEKDIKCPCPCPAGECPHKNCPHMKK